MFELYLMMRCRREARRDWSLGLFIHEVGASVATETHVRFSEGLVLRRSAIDFLFSREAFSASLLSVTFCQRLKSFALLSTFSHKPESDNSELWRH